MIPGRGASTSGPAQRPSLAQVVEQVLAVDDELHLVGQARVLQGVARELAILLVVVGEQDRERPRRASNCDIGLL